MKFSRVLGARSSRGHRKLGLGSCFVRWRVGIEQTGQARLGLAERDLREAPQELRNGQQEKQRFVGGTSITLPIHVQLSDHPQVAGFVIPRDVHLALWIQGRSELRLQCILQIARLSGVMRCAEPE